MKKDLGLPRHGDCTQDHALDRDGCVGLQNQSKPHTLVNIESNEMHRGCNILGFVLAFVGGLLLSPLIFEKEAGFPKAFCRAMDEKDVDTVSILATNDANGRKEVPSTRRTQTTCPTQQRVEASSPWDVLSNSERSRAYYGLRAKVPLQGSSNPFMSDAVRFISEEEPPKEEMLAYLDHGGPKPKRYARVIVSFGSKGFIMEYRVGPLNDGETVEVTPLTQPNEIPSHLLLLTSSQWSAVRNIINGFVGGAEVQNFLTDAFGSTSTIEWHYHLNEMKRDRPLSLYVSYKRKSSLLDNTLSHPLPFEFKVDLHPRWESSEWKIHSILYRNQFFPQTTDFINALSTGTVNITSSATFTTNPEWQTLNRRDSSRPNNDDAPAINVEPGARYTVEGGRIKWLGWSLHVKNRRRTAMAIHDVSFNGQRIAYELSLQELEAVYSGRVPFMANKFLFDSVFQYGKLNRALTRGIDCPKDATYFHNICVFEHDDGLPLWRKDATSSWYAGAKATKLVVRSVFPVGNYDYMVEAKFGLDGQIDMGFGATGHLFMSPYDPNEESFGTRVNEEALANIHAHYAGFKVDLDVLGVDNCVEKTEVLYSKRSMIPGTSQDPPGFDVPEKNTHIVRSIMDNENETRVEISNTKPSIWKIVSCNVTNRWGYRRGYELEHPNTPLAIYDDAGPGFTKHHMVFARRKEEEPFLTREFDFMSRGEPYVPISGQNGISNGENITETDLVAWVSLGFYHVPRVEDNPVTNVVASHFHLKPSNYFDENPSLDLGQVVRRRSSDITDDVPSAGCSMEV